MRYNFDEIIDRSGTYSIKYDYLAKHYGSSTAIPLWVADMDFRTAPCIAEAIEKRAAQGIYGYTMRPREYFEVISDWQARRNHYRPEISKMSYATGVVPAMRLMLTSFTEPGDKVIIQNPVYHYFADIVNNTGRQLVNSPLKKEGDRYVMDYEDFEEKARQGARYFILCNPHNPVGRCWSAEELKRLGDICVKYGIEVISDEIHGDLMLDGHQHTVFASLSSEIAALTTTCTAPSKTFNLAGLQACTVIFNTVEKRRRFDREMDLLSIDLSNCFSVVATLAACKDGEEWLDELRIYLSENMKFIRDFCAKEITLLHPNTPEATYLCWIDARELGLSDEALLRFCVDQAGIAPSMGVEFGEGGSGYLRINAACPRQVLEKAFCQLRDAINAR